ncbi:MULTISPECIES: hypothetical protein [Flectobacillus]|jgi:hypothetical protein|uniref:hypothetical protein n=1 Tax=Flectobacillus TaxID=101 RepID=UPI001140599E|nr:MULTISPECIES: hypothetical protein [Flectobacillus]MDI9872539.1 hypothetical protein [Flectobacillus roseus]NBA76747.1 hypothetical protein [Emticicia sp. ODNR4P]
MENLKFKKYSLLVALLIGLTTLMSSCVTHVRGYDYGYRRPYYGRPAYRYAVPPPRRVIIVPDNRGHSRYSYRGRRGRW